MTLLYTFCDCYTWSVSWDEREFLDVHLPLEIDEAEAHYPGRQKIEAQIAAAKQRMAEIKPKLEARLQILWEEQRQERERQRKLVEEANTPDDRKLGQLHQAMNRRMMPDDRNRIFDSDFRFEQRKKPRRHRPNKAELVERAKPWAERLKEMEVNTCFELAEEQDRKTLGGSRG